MKDVYARTEIFFCNVEEAQKILNVTTRDVKELAQKVMALGPKIAVITDGPAGAYAYDGTTMFFLKPYPDPKPPLERTGAGDAFAGAFMAALVSAAERGDEYVLHFATSVASFAVEGVGVSALATADLDAALTRMSGLRSDEETVNPE